MKRGYLAFFLIVAAWSSGNAAFAWCESHPNVETEFKSSAVVFVGEVLGEQEVVEPGDFVAGTIYTVQIKEVLKGRPSNTTKLYSENSSGRFPMKVGVDYLVFASRGVFEGIKDLQLAINNCGNSTTLQEAGKALIAVRKLSASKAQLHAPGDAPEAARP